VEYAVTQVFYVTDKNVIIAGNMTEALPFSQLLTCTTVAFKKKTYSNFVVQLLF